MNPLANDPRFGRAEVTKRQVTRLTPHFEPRPGSLAFADQRDQPDQSDQSDQSDQLDQPATTGCGERSRVRSS